MSDVHHVLKTIAEYIIFLYRGPVELCLLEIVLLILGFLFKWRWGLILSGLSKIVGDFYFVTMPMFRKERTKYIIRFSIEYVLGVFLGIALFTNLGFKSGTSILGGIAVINVLENTIVYFLPFIKFPRP